MGLSKEANSRRYITISIGPDCGAHGICSSFLILGQPPIGESTLLSESLRIKDK